MCAVLHGIAICERHGRQGLDAALRRGGLEVHRDKPSKRARTSPDEVLEVMRLRLPTELAWHILNMASFRYKVAACMRKSALVACFGAEGLCRTLQAHGAEVVGVQFFSFGHRALTWSRDGMACIWDIVSAKPLVELRHQAPVMVARVFPRDDRVATCSGDGACAVWDSASGEVLSALSTQRLSWLEVFPNASPLAVLWDPAVGRVTHELRGHTAPISAGKVFPSGDAVVTGGKDRRAITWDARSGAVSHILEHPYHVQGVAIIGGGDMVAVATGTHLVMIWSASGSMLQIVTLGTAGLPGSFAGVEAIPVGSAWSPSTWRASSFGMRRKAGRSGAAVRFGPSGSSCPAAVTFSPHGAAMASSSGTRSPASACTTSRSCLLAALSLSVFGGSKTPPGFGQGLSWHELAPPRL